MNMTASNGQSASSIEVEVVRADAIVTPGDVLILKYAQPQLRRG